MTPGPPRGASVSRELSVTASMADPLGADGQAIASIESMVSIMADAHQELLTPHLDPGECIVAEEATFTWRAPVPVGAELEFVLTAAQVSRTNVMSEVVVRRGGRMVGRGTHRVRLLAQGAFASEVAATS